MPLTSTGFARKTPVIALVRRGQDDPHLDLDVTVTLDGMQLLRSPFRVMFGAGDVARCFGSFTGLKVPAPGVLTFALSHGGDVLGDWSIRLRASRHAASREDAVCPGLPEQDPPDRRTGYLH